MIKLTVFLFLFGCAFGQNYRVCIPSSETRLCNNLELGGSQAVCESVESRIDCAIKLGRRAADIGSFTEEETLLLGLQQTAWQQSGAHRVVATIRDVARTEPYAFEAVAVVPRNFTGGLDGLRGFNYCHPGLDSADNRWSPRVLKAFETAAARLHECPADAPAGRTVEELELQRLAEFFPHACRPGTWSHNSTVDADLKRTYPTLCSLCTPTGTQPDCSGYSVAAAMVSVAGVDNNNRHIQALECMRTNGNAVAYVAWQHAREFFNSRPEQSASFAVLCPDGAATPLTVDLLQSNTAPCAFVRQPWATIVANAGIAAEVQASLRQWWSDGLSPAAGSWQAAAFSAVVGGLAGSSARVYFEDGLPTPANYTNAIRPIPAMDATTSCQPARRWCTLSADEQTKCQWVSAAAYTLGVQPPISCQQRTDIFECLNEIKENRVDFIASSSNYGYLARQHYSLSPVKLLQNPLRATTRVAAFVKESTAQNNVTRFENLRGKKACFPEYGGIAYVSFLRAAQERSVISASECDYSRAVGEFFDGACAPGALNATHSLGQSSFDATSLCTVCRPAGSTSNSDFTCAWDHSNRFFGNNGTVACLADPNTDVAVLRINNMAAHLEDQGLNASNYRALCRDGTLAVNAGYNISDGCLLAHIVDAEVLTRRNDPLNNALSVLLETLDVYFGYAAESGTQLINLEIFSPFDNISDLLFKDSAIGFTEPSTSSDNEQAREYIRLFQHLESCTGGAAAAFTPYNLATMMVLAVLARFVVY